MRILKNKLKKIKTFRLVADERGPLPPGMSENRFSALIWKVESRSSGDRLSRLSRLPRLGQVCRRRHKRTKKDSRFVAFSSNSQLPHETAAAHLILTIFSFVQFKSLIFFFALRRFK